MNIPWSISELGNGLVFQADATLLFPTLSLAAEAVDHKCLKRLHRRLARI